MTPRRRPSRPQPTSRSGSGRCRSAAQRRRGSWSTGSSTRASPSCGACRRRPGSTSRSSTRSWRSRRRRRWGRSSSPTCSDSTPCCTWPSTFGTPTAIASSSTSRCRSWSPPAISAPRPERGSMSTAADIDTTALVDRFTLKALVESCLVLEEGLASMKDIDLGLMAGAGIMPPPFARADQQGLDEVLAKLERAAQDWGEAFEPPLILRRLVAQGRLGVNSGQGFFPYPRPDPGYDDGPVKLETRDRVAIAWLDRPPANSIAPEVVEALGAVWARVSSEPEIR